MKKRRLQPFGQRTGVLEPGVAPSVPGRDDDVAGDIDHEQLGKIFRLAQLVQQGCTVEVGEIAAEMVPVQPGVPTARGSSCEAIARGFQRWRRSLPGPVVP